MKQLKTYVKELDFEYAKSYSGLRGSSFESFKDRVEKEISQIETEMITARFMQKPKLRKKIEILNDGINPRRALVINKEGKLHQSANFVYGFEKGSKELDRLLKILNSSIKEQVTNCCLPVFRDSIVFYSKENEIKGILPICFECTQIKNENGESLKVDGDFYQKIASELIKLGHRIQNE